MSRNEGAESETDRVAYAVLILFGVFFGVALANAAWWYHTGPFTGQGLEDAATRGIILAFVSVTVTALILEKVGDRIGV